MSVPFFFVAAGGHADPLASEIGETQAQLLPAGRFKGPGGIGKNAADELLVMLEAQIGAGIAVPVVLVLLGNAIGHGHHSLSA